MSNFYFFFFKLWSNNTLMRSNKFLQSAAEETEGALLRVQLRSE